MPLGVPIDAAVFPPKKLFANLSNIVSESTSFPNDIQVIHSEVSHKKWSCRHDPRFICYTYEQAMKEENDALMRLREKIEKPIFQELCNRVHHSTYSLDDLVDSIETYFEDFFVKGENLEFSPGKDRTVMAKVLAVEKKGGAVFYTIEYDDKEIGRISGSDLKRLYQVTADDIRSMILLMGSQQPGKPWQIEETYKKEYGVKDKLAPIFCASQSKLSNKGSNKREKGKTTSDNDSDSDAPLSEFVGRRSGVALPPNASSKEFDKQRRKMEMKQRKENQRKEKLEKKDQKENSAQNLDKFVSSPLDSNVEKKNGSAGSSFLTPQKRSEKRFCSAVKKLQDAWNKYDEQEFIAAAAWSAKVLSGVQIDRIPNECHRFAVRKAYNKVKDAEALKKIPTKEGRKEFREKVRKERHVYQKVMLARIKRYFGKESAMEDLTLSDEVLSCCGHPISVKHSESPMFTECLVFTQFFSSLKKFIEADHSISAKCLFDALHDGRIGYVRYTAKLLGSLLKTLLQDSDYRKITHHSIRLHEFAIEENTVSELCRAILIGNLGLADEKNHNAELNAEHIDALEVRGNEDMESGRGSGRATPSDFNLSQIDMDVCHSFLSRFSAEKELWELSPEDQLGILGLILNRVLELRSFKDYISQEGLSETARNLEEKIGKQTEEINVWQEELTLIPEIEDVVDTSLLSRSQTRERTEIMKQRESLAKKIEEGKDKLKDLLEKLKQEKLAKSQSRRITPIGEDRHFRRYFWFNMNSPDDGIWIQDMGISAYEKFIRACIKAGRSYVEDDDECEQDCVQACSESGKCSSIPEFSAFAASQTKPENDYSGFGHDRYSEVWWKISDETSFGNLMNSLNKLGVREGKLRAFLLKKRDVILASLRRESTQEKQDCLDEEEDSCSEAITPLRNSVVQLASDLGSSYFTNIVAIENFEAQMVCCTTLHEIKLKLCELADSITPSAILRRLDFKTDSQNGNYSVMNLDRWKQRLSECQNASGVHLLRSYLDSRINWKNSVVEKRCSSCGSRRTPESKIACSNCFYVIHYYCTRPKLQEKPITWLCPTCATMEERKKKEEDSSQQYLMKKTSSKIVNYCEESSDDDSDNDLSCDSESDDDDFFVSKRLRSGRKRVLDDYFENGQTTGAKRTKPNSIAKECYEILNRIKASNRLYRTLQNIPPARTNKRGVPSSIDGLEEAIDEYTSLSLFMTDLRHFLKHAHSYLEEHNERKLEELERVLTDLNLESIINC